MIRRTFTAQGLRCTRQREAIYAALASTKMHPTAEQLYEMVCRDFPGLSLATIYNTLDTFCNVGLCQKIPVTGASARYDATTDDHLHVFNKDTGAVIDVPDELGSQLLSQLPADLITQIENVLQVDIDRISMQLVGRSKPTKH